MLISLDISLDTTVNLKKSQFDRLDNTLWDKEGRIKKNGQNSSVK